MSFQETVQDILVENIIDWIITAIITYFTVRAATRQYYDSTKRNVSKGIMELGLRSLLKLDHSEEIPGYAQTIFVEYRGRCFDFLHAKSNHCRIGTKIRKTVEVVGGNRDEVSDYRPINYGVLGVANKLKTPVLFDFNLKKLYKYSRESITEISVESGCEGEFYYVSNNDKILLMDEDTERDVMIALPLLSNHKLVGGVTFDLKAGEKTIYQKYCDDDDSDIKDDKDAKNIKVFKEAMRATKILANAYFKKKGDEFENGN
ncbi:MAG: hypothetical protein MJ177_05610 [Clostridia bacterium]|nr:hypothetical protein [Clostridia bacterium]